MHHRRMSAAVTTAAPPRSVGDAVAATLRHTAIVVVGCGVAGALVGGIGGRLVMRLAALAAPEVRGALTENGNVVADITLEGTIGLVIFAGASSAIFGAGAYTVAGPWLPRSALARGLVFGGFLLALMGSTVVDPGNADFVILGDRLLNVAMFSGLFIAFGVVASAVVAFIEGRVPLAPALSPRMWALTVLCALPVIPGLAVVTLGFAPGLGIPLVGAWATMLVSTALDRRGLRGPALLARASATAVLMVVVAIAGADYVDGVATIL
jgi:CBS domain-containing protein